MRKMEMDDEDQETLLDTLNQMQDAITACGNSIDTYYKESRLGRPHFKTAAYILTFSSSLHARSGLEGAHR